MKVKILSNYPKQTLEVNNVYFSSDLHLNHESVIKFGRKFDNVEQMNNHILNEINSKVMENDLLVLLGDTMMGEKDYLEFTNSLKSENIILLVGNHDNRAKLLNCQFNSEKDVFVSDYLELYINGKIICCSHYPMFNWNYQNDGSFMLHGHCVDSKSEILTNNGWKTYKTIEKNDLVYSENDEGFLELCPIDNIIVNNYSGKTIQGNSKSISINYTDKHKAVFYNTLGKKYFINADEIIDKKVRKMKTCGHFNNSGINLDTIMLKLYICIAADGSVKKETNHIRLHAGKEYKITYFKKLLTILNISYKHYTNSRGMSTLNFYLPKELEGWNIKGLDSKLFKANKKDCESILEAYNKTDGVKNGNGTIIYTSKKQEIDILQHIFVINGFSAKTLTRVGHGFSKAESYQLSVYPRDIINVSVFPKNLKEVEVTNEVYWCIETSKFKNFLVRTDGAVHITGNCHGDENEIIKQIHEYKCMDVGIDNYFKMFGKYSIFAYEEICKILKNKKVIERHDNK